MNVFADFHHAGLLYSFYLTLERRFGWAVYRPIGMEWFERDYFGVAKPYGNNPETVKQFLSMSPNQKPSDGSPPLNKIKDRNPGLSHYVIRDEYHSYDQKGMTFDQFINADIDIIIASIPDHWHTYRRLRDTFKPKAKLVLHAGNMFNELADLNSLSDVNLMASTVPLTVPEAWSKVFYYQEQPVRHFVPAISTHTISSYAHVMPNKELFEQYKQALTSDPEDDIVMQSYGAGNADGWKDSLGSLYASMQWDQAVWHVKPGGDGYGWNWHSAYMLGRPVITNYSDYKDKLGGILHTDMETGIDLEKRSFEDNVKLIRDCMNDGRFIEMGKQARLRWEQHVNYDNEADKLKKFFENLH